MSDNILDADDMFDDAAGAAGEVVEDVTDQVGLTSEESGDETPDSNSEKKGIFSSFTVFDSMLLISLICISVATLLMFRELSTFGNVLAGEFPWQASEFGK